MQFKRGIRFTDLLEQTKRCSFGGSQPADNDIRVENNIDRVLGLDQACILRLAPCPILYFANGAKWQADD